MVVCFTLDPAAATAAVYEQCLGKKQEPGWPLKSVIWDADAMVMSQHSGLFRAQLDRWRDSLFMRQREPSGEEIKVAVLVVGLPSPQLLEAAGKSRRLNVVIVLCSILI